MKLKTNKQRLKNSPVALLGTSAPHVGGPLPAAGRLGTLGKLKMLKQRERGSRLHYQLEKTFSMAFFK